MRAPNQRLKWNAFTCACWTSLERVRNAFLCSHVSELHCTNRRVERRTADVSSVHSPSLKWSESMKHKTCAPDRVLRRRFLSARWFLCVCHVTFSEVFWTKKRPWSYNGRSLSKLAFDSNRNTWGEVYTQSTLTLVFSSTVGWWQTLRWYQTRTCVQDRHPRSYEVCSTVYQSEIVK